MQLNLHGRLSRGVDWTRRIFQKPTFARSSSRQPCSRRGGTSPQPKLAQGEVIWLGLQPRTVQQGELALQDDQVLDRGRHLMSMLDGLNQRDGRGTVLLVGAGLAVARA